jgi:hypothetical protein
MLASLRFASLQLKNVLLPLYLNNGSFRLVNRQEHLDRHPEKDDSALVKSSCEVVRVV